MPETLILPTFEPRGGCLEVLLASHYRWLRQDLQHLADSRQMLRASHSVLWTRLSLRLPPLGLPKHQPIQHLLETVGLPADTTVASPENIVSIGLDKLINKYIQHTAHK